ncbi:hypothetical protein GWK47_037140 [Chionoecetes opilio]|uniref:Uncharacterized protein n=1 Tax=Chionoecetes opilio TaxID=41210 RepID=A0A8J5CMR2_CHIOP|nr:hypothetical protein GWK47_037140 [Chionoecetes opilio]
MDYLSKHSILTPTQHGFRPHCCGVSCLSRKATAMATCRREGRLAGSLAVHSLDTFISGSVRKVWSHRHTAMSRMYPRLYTSPEQNTGRRAPFSGAIHGKRSSGDASSYSSLRSSSSSSSSLYTLSGKTCSAATCPLWHAHPRSMMWNTGSAIVPV